MLARRFSGDNAHTKAIVSPADICFLLKETIYFDVHPGRENVYTAVEKNHVLEITTFNFIMRLY